MTAVWMVVALVGAVTMGLKSVGPLLIGGRELPRRVDDVVALVAPAVLAALVAVQIFAGERALAVDARVVGLGAAIFALLVRAPLLVVVLAAAVATAVARAL